jgi:hypothetical protein
VTSRVLLVATEGPLPRETTHELHLQAVAAEMAAWRHDLHAHPEFGFELRRTAALVADKLRSFGFDEVVEGSVALASSARCAAALPAAPTRAVSPPVPQVQLLPYGRVTPGYPHSHPDDTRLS